MAAPARSASANTSLPGSLEHPRDFFYLGVLERPLKRVLALALRAEGGLL